MSSVETRELENVTTPMTLEEAVVPERRQERAAREPPRVYVKAADADLII